MPVLLTDAECAAILLFLTDCECQGDAVGAICRELLLRARQSLHQTPLPALYSHREDARDIHTDRTQSSEALSNTESSIAAAEALERGERGNPVWRYCTERDDPITDTQPIDDTYSA